MGPISSTFYDKLDATVAMLTVQFPAAAFILYLVTKLVTKLSNRFHDVLIFRSQVRTDEDDRPIVDRLFQKNYPICSEDPAW